MKKLLLTCCLLTFMTACSAFLADTGLVKNYRKNLGQLSVGMTKAEALETMQHNPDRISAKGNTEYLIYSYRNEEYFIRLIDGKVEAYGMQGDFDSTKDPTFNLNIKQK